MGRPNSIIQEPQRVISLVVREYENYVGPCLLNGGLMRASGEHQHDRQHRQTKFRHRFCTYCLNTQFDKIREPQPISNCLNSCADEETGVYAARDSTMSSWPSTRSAL